MQSLSRYIRPLVCGVALCAIAWSTDLRASNQPSRNGKELYQATCASCHGPGGAGGDPGIVHPPVPLPDFSDCTFAPREPDSDWASIIQEGGPARGFNTFMPAFGDALTDPEIALILGHVRTFCDDDRYARGELNLPKALRTEKAFPEDELLLVSRVGTGDSPYSQNKLIFEKRIGPSSQIELVAPFAALQSGLDSSWTAGIGDLAAAFKQVLGSSLRTGTITSLTLETVLPTGDTDRGLGGGEFVIEPFWTLGQLLPADFFMQTQVGTGIPLSFEEYELFARLTTGKTFTQAAGGRSWSPMIEVLFATPLGEGFSPEWTFVPQTQVTLSQRQHVRLNVGLGLPLEDGSLGQPELMMYLLWDWYDGGLLAGW